MVSSSPMQWTPLEMNKAHALSKPAQVVQFTKDIESDRNQQSGTQMIIRNQQKVHNHQHNHQNNRNVYQRLRAAISPYNTINGTYSIGKKLGEGSFGVIYQGTDINTKELVAIKFEPKKTDAPQLADEYRFYKIINPTIGFPKCYYFGREGSYSVLCIELLGPSLEDLFDLCGRKFSVKTVCMAAKQMISRIWSIHEHKYIYRDIKPDNFLIGRVARAPENHFEIYNSIHTPPNVGRKIVDYYMSLRGKILSEHTPETPHPSSLIYIVDFGMAKQYLDPYTQTHIPYREKKSLSGTARYMSINTHLGIEQSRRDDLEALGHVLMYFLRGSLPWQGLRGATNKQKYEKIGDKKQSTLIRSLCAGYPKEFETYLYYARSLKFNETPNYKYLIKLFDRVLEKIGEKDDGIFDWMIEMDHQAEKDQLRENAWKRRDERDYGYLSIYWQNQYYGTLSKKNENSYRHHPLNITSPSSTANPNHSFNPLHQLPLNSATLPKHYIPQKPKPIQVYQHHHTHVPSKKKTLALDSYCVNPGLTSAVSNNNDPSFNIPISSSSSSNIHKKYVTNPNLNASIDASHIPTNDSQLTSDRFSPTDAPHKNEASKVAFCDENKDFFFSLSSSPSVGVDKNSFSPLATQKFSSNDPLHSSSLHNPIPYSNESYDPLDKSSPAPLHDPDILHSQPNIARSQPNTTRSQPNTAHHPNSLTDHLSSHHNQSSHLKSNSSISSSSKFPPPPLPPNQSTSTSHLSPNHNTPYVTPLPLPSSSSSKPEPPQDKSPITKQNLDPPNIKSNSLKSAIARMSFLKKSKKKFSSPQYQQQNAPSSNQNISSPHKPKQSLHPHNDSSNPNLTKSLSNFKNIFKHKWNKLFKKDRKNS